MFERDPKKGYNGYYYMTTEELINNLKAMNPEWGNLYERDLKELLLNAQLVEEALKQFEHVGNEVFEDSPLTGTPEEREKKYTLRRIQMSIMSSIVRLFKENTNMESLNFSEKKFLYENRKECKKSGRK